MLELTKIWNLIKVEEEIQLSGLKEKFSLYSLKDPGKILGLELTDHVPKFLGIYILG
jgi:hypothetical protein